MNARDKLLYLTQGVNFLRNDERMCFSPGLVAGLGNAGLFSLAAPKNHGGLELSYSEIMEFFEAAGTVDISIATFLGIQNALVTQTILNSNRSQGFFSDELSLLAQGRSIGAFALTEPQSGTNATRLKCVARKSQGGYILSGEKTWIGAADWASLLILIANSVSECGKNMGSIVVLLRLPAVGVSIGPEIPSVGIRGFPRCEVSLTDCFVSNDCVLAAPGKGLDFVLDSICLGRIGIAAISIGAMRKMINSIDIFSKKRRISSGILHEAKWVKDALKKPMRE